MSKRGPARIRSASIDAIVRAIHSRARVDGLTHNFYKYPARFSPEFAESVIAELSEPDDWILDPFMGGGTTVVEAVAAGRRVVGSDLNPLAAFVTDAKSSPLDEVEIQQLCKWKNALPDATHIRSKVAWDPQWDGYDSHVPWWLRKTIQLAIRRGERLGTRRLRMVARCSLARTAQWALDNRTHLPTRQEFLGKHATHLEEMLRGSAELRHRVVAIHGERWRREVSKGRRVIVRSAGNLGCDNRYPSDWGAPSLILTSPPYAGVHILYHRWQVQGRRETAAPYWIVGKHNGRHAAYFTFADRKRGMDGYLGAMREAYSSVIRLMDSRTTLVQLVAFSNPEEHLQAYLKELRTLGLRQVELLTSEGDDRHTVRIVPNRKWYAQLSSHAGASKEFLLIHRRR